MKIPTLIFPGKFKVSVYTLSQKEFERLAPSNSAACWLLDKDGKGGGIYLESGKPKKELLDDLRHEMQHALVDWTEYYFSR